MPKPLIRPSYESIVYDFTIWLRENTDNLLSNDSSLVLSLIKKKWKGLIEDYVFTKVKIVIEALGNAGKDPQSILKKGEKSHEI